MSGQQHIVQKLIIEVGLDSRDEAFGLQTKIVNDYQRLLLKSMSEVFDRLVGGDEFLSIDKLEIDIGRIAISDLEYELPEKIKKEVEEALVKLLFEARGSQNGAAEVRFVAQDGNAITVRANFKDRSASLFDTLIYYLEFGLLPWTSDKKEKPGLRFLLGEAMIHHPAELRKALMQFQNKNYIFRRLALQLRDDQLQYLASITGCGFSSDLPDLFNKIRRFVEAIMQQLAKEKHTIKSTVEKTVKVFLWQETLQYFSIGNKSAASSPEADFVARILKRLFTELEINIARIKLPKGDFEEPARKAVKQLQEEEQVVIKIKEELPEAPEADEGIYIANAGLVILATYLPGFFRNMGLVEGKEFVSDEARWKAVHLLQWMVYGDKGAREEKENDVAGDEKINEHDLALNKILCGIDIAEPVPLEPDLSEAEKEEANILLRAVIQNWKIINRISIQSLQITFLQKEGKLKREAKNWSLFIHRDSGVDIIIDRLPWTISMIKMPWNKETVYVEW
ncbi:MAG: contractile injection system tape measure protein [Bacteroidota bacterium]|nr:contractile injection system tape measure protein [Bacteroidota bacterium]